MVRPHHHSSAGLGARGHPMSVVDPALNLEPLSAQTRRTRAPSVTNGMRRGAAFVTPRALAVVPALPVAGLDRFVEPSYLYGPPEKAPRIRAQTTRGFLGLRVVILEPWVYRSGSGRSQVRPTSRLPTLYKHRIRPKQPSRSAVMPTRD